MAVATPLAGVLSDKVRKRISTGATRKLFFLIGNLNIFLCEILKCSDNKNVESVQMFTKNVRYF